MLLTLSSDLIVSNNVLEENIPPDVRFTTKIGLFLFLFYSIYVLMQKSFIPSSKPGRSINFIYNQKSLEGTDIATLAISTILFMSLQAFYNSLILSNSNISFVVLTQVLRYTFRRNFSLSLNFTAHLMAVALFSLVISRFFPISLLRRVLFPALVMPTTTYLCRCVIFFAANFFEC